MYDKLAGSYLCCIVTGKQYAWAAAEFLMSLNWNTFHCYIVT